MKALIDLFKSPFSIKIAALFLACIATFFLGKHWSHDPSQLIFFNPNTNASEANTAPSAPISSNSLRTINISSFISTASTQVPPLPPPVLIPSPPPPSLERFEVVDQNGEMKDDFDAGLFDLEVGGNQALWNETMVESGVGEGRVRVDRFQPCVASTREYIPCLDNLEAIEKFNASERGEKFERHCPDEGKRLNCLVPAPEAYKTSIPWPKSREEVWFNNVPHTRLVEEKGGQNWIARDGEKFRFPGGGTQFIHGADQYIQQISVMVQDIAFGSKTRIVLDVGCGVASFGAYLFSRDVITMSIAPKDAHENQIQFALERGVPAMVAVFATHRLFYPSQAFDLVHCSRCRINWTRDGGILLLEVNRMLRSGGYFVWAAQPVYKHEEAQQEAWKEMVNLTARICWKLVKKEGYIAIWKKPSNNTCYNRREAGVQPSLCDPDDNPDDVWYVNLKACISRLPESGFERDVSPWPDRLHVPPQRLQAVQMDAYMAKNELFKAESAYWNEIIGSYVNAFRWKEMNLRNVMDMRAGLGGFAAAMIDLLPNSWVMNVVPTSEPNTLPVIYDRGLVGVAHDWCEPFDTYPRTYDLLHAYGLFSREQKRCNITTILLEMDRILRPGGRAYIRDFKYIIDEIQAITLAMGWRANQFDTSEGLYSSRRILICDK
ncbi:probable methyltransferase PMT11 isoform X1 [Phalaenopsis equestris]|uniref:probable methyltransferase PMT11 isoform X1 n=1 Tax=Phalaenopsis equestris TaxID=78828 RepID=UPI0009E4050D|nr:probable methyltransferase PMT11 isoform X1 [Phalaenopsis equestris]